MSSIRCHTVPEFYLKYFLAPGESCLWVYDKKDLAVRPQLPKDTTVIGDYYLSSPDKEGKKNAAMEQIFSIIEGTVKPIFDSWINDPSSIDNKDLPSVAMFLSYMHSRAPRAVEATKEIYMAGVEGVVDKWKGIAQDPERLKDYYQKYCDAHPGQSVLTLEECAEVMAEPLKKFKFEANEKHAIGSTLLMAETIQRHIMNMYWSIRYIKGDHFFVTNDAPMIIFVPFEEEEKAIFGGGLEMPNVEISFPLSPKTCLWITKKRRVKCERIDAGFVTEINRRSVCVAERFIISPYKSNRIQKIVKEFAPLYGRPKMDSEILKQGFKQRSNLRVALDKEVVNPS